MVDPKDTVPNILGFVDFRVVQLALTPSRRSAGSAEMPPGCFRDAVKMLQRDSLAQALPTALEIAQPTVTCRRDGEV